MCKISGFNVGDVFVVEKKTVDNSANWIKMIFSLVLEINYHSGLCLGVLVFLLQSRNSLERDSGRLFMAGLCLNLLEKFDCFCCWNCYNFIGATSYNALWIH